MTLFSTDRQLHCIHGYVMQKDFQHEKMLSPQTALHYIHKQSMILILKQYTRCAFLTLSSSEEFDPKQLENQI